MKHRQDLTTNRSVFLFQVEREIRDGKYDDSARILEEFLQKNPEDREASLYHLLAKIKLHGVGGFAKEIDRIKEFVDLEERERWVVRQIFFVLYDDARNRGDHERAVFCQNSLERLFSGLSVPAAAESEIAQGVIQPMPSHLLPKLPETTPRPKETVPAPRSATLEVLKQPRLARLSVVAALLLGGVVVYGLTSGVEKEKFAGAQAPAMTDISTETETPQSAPAAEAAENLVVAASELGLEISGPAGKNIKKETLRQTIENQLSNLRQIYNQEIEKKPDLMGLILVQLNIGARGNVTGVRELLSRIQDREFQQVVLQEAAKWKFSKEVRGPLRVNFPLLFVPIGMDVNTLVKWEQTVGGLRHQANGQRLVKAPGTGDSSSNRRTKESVAAETAGAGVQEAESQPPKAGVESAAPSAGAYEVRTHTVLRSEPRFAASSLEELEAGTNVNVVGFKGDWLQVVSHTSQSGFIRREFARPLISNREDAVR